MKPKPRQLSVKCLSILKRLFIQKVWTKINSIFHKFLKVKKKKKPSIIFRKRIESL